MSIFSQGGKGSGVFGYPYSLNQSVRLNEDDSAYMSQVVGTLGDRKTWSFSTWFKRGNIDSSGELLHTLGAGGFGVEGTISIAASGAVDWIWDYNGGSRFRLLTNRLLRDTSAWYHIFCVADSTDATSADRLQIWINGIRETSFSVENQPSLNYDGELFADNSTNYLFGNSSLYDGYASETFLIDAQALTASDFGEFKNGIWIPIPYSGSFSGAESSYLDYSNASHFGEDQSGEGNDWTDNNLTTDDQVLDSPTNNWCILNRGAAYSQITLSNGNLVGSNAAATWYAAPGTMGVIEGKWYFEVELVGDFLTMLVGVGGEDWVATLMESTAGNYVGQDTDSWGILPHSSITPINKYTNSITTGTNMPVSTAGDTIQVAFDVDAGKVWFGRNNTWVDSGDPAAGTGEQYSGLPGLLFPGLSCNDTDGQIVDFGQHGFAYTPPGGFKAINWKNISESGVIIESLYLQGNKAFDAVLYQGTGAELVITDLNFSPDLVWIKNRDADDEHVLTDTVRGATKELNSDSTNIESTETQGLKSFDSFGFTLGTKEEYNTNTENYVAWNWKENPIYGFDIVNYEGTGAAHTEAHNLGVVPEMMIVKNRETAALNWAVYHKDNTVAPETDFLKLNLTDATADDVTVWNDTAPTSSVFTVGTSSAVNENLKDHIAYLFASVEGYSKVFSYTGNGNADGPFIYCGFRPRFMLIKNIDSTPNWRLMDTERDPYNAGRNALYANLTNAEATDHTIDYLSNGFKPRDTSAAYNGSGVSYIGITFSETPFPWANAR